MKTHLSVELAAHRYPIEIGEDLTAAVRQTVEARQAQGHPLAVLVDANVAAAHPKWLQRALGDLPRLELPSGERTKSFNYLQRCGDFLAEQRVDRSGALFAVGGGVTGDLAGFAAASYLRGIDFYQVPTTLLAMVDSSVGGKTGINLAAGKNLVGAFWQPQAVWCDLGLLATLPAREFAAGMAEVIKYGMLAEVGLFNHLDQLDRLHPGHDELAAVVRRCCAIKAQVVADDEKEQAKSGGRALLNLGHTFAHAIEAVAGYGEYLHGEAVGVGLVLAAQLSHRLGHLTEPEVRRVAALVHRYDLPTRLRAPLSLDGLMAAMARDKKVRAGQLRFVILAQLGAAVTAGDIDPALVSALLRDAGARG